MTLGDVIEQVIYNDELRCTDPKAHDLAILIIGELGKKYKPDAQWRPLSPPEARAVKEELERMITATRAVVAAMGGAKARKPRHFYIVRKGGR